MRDNIGKKVHPKGSEIELLKTLHGVKELTQIYLTFTTHLLIIALQLGGSS